MCYTDVAIRIALQFLVSKAHGGVFETVLDILV